MQAMNKIVENPNEAAFTISKLHKHWNLYMINTVVLIPVTIDIVNNRIMYTICLIIKQPQNFTRHIAFILKDF